MTKSQNSLAEIERTLEECLAGRITEEVALPKVEAELDAFRSIQRQIAWIIDEIITEKV